MTSAMAVFGLFFKCTVSSQQLEVIIHESSRHDRSISSSPQTVSGAAHMLNPPGQAMVSTHTYVVRTETYQGGIGNP